MAGILSNSISVTMTSGTPDNTTSGFLSGEMITLTTLPTGADYVWAITKPSTSGARSDLSDSAGFAVTFTPDAPGYYSVQCTVDAVTAYILRIAVSSIGAIADRSIVRFTPLATAQVPVPVAGVSVFSDSVTGLLSQKSPSGVLLPLADTIAAAAPTTGAHVIGERVYNSAPASAGFVGWVCTAAGTPGTWKTWGLIS